MWTSNEPRVTRGVGVVIGFRTKNDRGQNILAPLPDTALSIRVEVFRGVQPFQCQVSVPIGHGRTAHQEEVADLIVRFYT